MLPPVSAPGPAPSPPKGTPSTASTLAVSASFGSTRIGAGPSGIRPETTRMVEAARQAPLAQRLRDNDTRKGLIPTDDLPAGPPPAFRETPLERQLRTALEPPDMVAEAENGRAPAGLTRAEIGFAEARALTSPDPKPDLDKKE